MNGNFFINVAEGTAANIAKNYTESKMYVGARDAIVIEGGTCGFAAPPPNPLVGEAIKNKLEMLVGMGAYFIQPGSAVKTATQSAGEQLVQTSILSLAASNVSDAYTKCINMIRHETRVNGFAAGMANQFDPCLTPHLPRSTKTQHGRRGMPTGT